MAKKRDEVSTDLADELTDSELALDREPLSAGEALADARAQDPDSGSLPEAKPGDPDYDWSGHYGTDELYRHAYPDGQVVALRRFKDIYSKQWLRSIRNLETEFDIESAAIDRAACDLAKQLIDNRPCPVGGPDDFQDLWRAWTSSDAEGVTPGE